MGISTLQPSKSRANPAGQGIYTSLLASIFIAILYMAYMAHIPKEEWRLWWVGVLPHTRRHGVGSSETPRTAVYGAKQCGGFCL